ncbi:MAG: aminopeptidase N C-terminal domain-containing protein [Paracoccaceae bacterium]
MLNPNGDEVLPPPCSKLTEAEQSFQLHRPRLAPDALDPARLLGAGDPRARGRQRHRAFLLAHDTDPFNRWQAGPRPGARLPAGHDPPGAAPDSAYLDALLPSCATTIRTRPSAALALGLPSQDELAQSLHDHGDTPDPRRSTTRSKP